MERIKEEGDKFLLLWPEPECTNVCFWYVPRRLRGQARTTEWEQELGRVSWGRRDDDQGRSVGQPD